MKISIYLLIVILFTSAVFCAEE